MRVEISKLTKIYNQGEKAVVALSELDLDIETSEICIVRGPNGSGKTTLVSILAGDIKESAGRIRLSTESGQKPQIAVVNQFDNLIADLTIREHFNILNHLENIDLIDPEILDKKPAEISRGQAQIVAVALALSSDTDLLLADEPTGALGHSDSELVYKFIRDTATKNNSAVILVTHDDAAEKIADRVVRLRDGRISEAWSPGEPEKQVVNNRGWVKLPEDVTSGLANEVIISPTESGAAIEGRTNSPSKKILTLDKKVPNQSIDLSVQELTASYEKQVVFQSLSLEVRQNSLQSIFGKSGAGKTTLLKSIVGFHKEITGLIEKPDDSKISYFNIENIFGLELNLKELNVNQKLIQDLQLEDLINRPLKTFSGGQKQRAMVAIALSSDAQILLLDEPTSALDDEMTGLVIKAILNSPKTIVAATHDERLVAVSNETLTI